MAGHQTYVNGLFAVLGTGMAWKPPPYRKPDYNILFAVFYLQEAAQAVLMPRRPK